MIIKLVCVCSRLELAEAPSCFASSFLVVNWYVQLMCSSNFALAQVDYIMSLTPCKTAVSTNLISMGMRGEKPLAHADNYFFSAFNNSRKNTAKPCLALCSEAIQ